jgi:lysophospholipase L1-like esterase
MAIRSGVFTPKFDPTKGKAGKKLGGGAVVAPVMRVAATRARSITNIAAANRQVMARSAHVASSDITALKIAVGNFRLKESVSNEQTGFGAATITASVEYPAGTFTQILFSGSASLSLADGSLSISDLTATLPTMIPSGATFWIRQYWVCATATPYNLWSNTAMGDLVHAVPSGNTDMTMGGTIPSDGPYSLPPLAIMAMTTGKSVCGIGDSKTHGQNDTAESATASGPGLRGEIFRSFPTSYPFVNLSTGGLQARQWSTQAIERAKLFPYFSHFIINLGRNDLWQFHDSVANITTNLQSIVNGVLAASPTAKITLCTQTHASSSTDSWATTVNQTVTSTADNGRRSTINAAIRAGTLLTGINNGYFEISDLVETARDSSIWPANGTANYATSDGIHESPAYYGVVQSSGVIDMTRFA